MDYDKRVVLVTHVPIGTGTPPQRADTGLTLAQAVRRIMDEPNPGLNRATTQIRCGAQTLGYDEISAIRGRPDFPEG